MELTNTNRINQGFDILLPIFVTEIERVYQAAYRDNWFNEVIEDGIEKWPNEWANLKTEDDVRNAIDIEKAVNIILYNWKSFQAATPSRIYNQKLRAWISELKENRNDVAHKTLKPISDDDTKRILDTMVRVCDALKPEKSDGIRKIIRDLLYSDDKMSSQLPAGAGKTATKREKEAMIIRGQLPAWRNVMQPNPDVAADRYKNADFAANLGEVAKGEGAQEYADPVDFFHRTYLTHGMKQLLIQAMKRVSLGNGDPVIQLKTSFGGGKTHTLLTLYHLMRQMVPCSEMRGVPELLAEAGIGALPKVHVVTLYCIDMDPTKSKRPMNLSGITINTMWGEIAAQLAISTGRPEIYDYVKEADKKGVSPGREALCKLFNECGSCIILIDEFVAYARKLYKVDKLPAGSFDNLMTFIQELSEAAVTSQKSLVVASIPESDIEIGTEEGGKIALKSIEKNFGRVESVWTPVEPTESFEIVRRRLFKSCDDEDARKLVCHEFSQMYVEHADEFPSESREKSYEKRLIDCYPIHPDVFDKLYLVWATLESFQRTRGVLRYMAGVVHYLWEIGDSSPLIMPCMMPFCDVQASNELIKHLNANSVWQPIISKEIDGSESTPNQIDQANSRFGQVNAARRMTRMIMFSTAPSSTSPGRQKVRGITRREIHLGVCLPGDNIPTYNDALDKLMDSLAFLYKDTMVDTHYWFDTRPTLRKMMQDRMSQIDLEQVTDNIYNLMKSRVSKNAIFDGVHVFPSVQDKVSDDQKLHLIILNPEQSYSGRDKGHLKAREAAENLLNHCGNSPRRFKNTLIFLAPDNNVIATVKNTVLEKLAWESIRSDSDKKVINLGKIEIDEITNNINKLAKTIETGLSDAYIWLLAPSFDTESNENEWEILDIRGQGKLMDQVIKNLRDNELIIENWAPRFLNDLLKQLYWKDERTDLEIKSLWQAMTSYCYMKRLANFDVLKSCIQKGIGDYFGYSSGGKNENDQYIGLTEDKNAMIDASGFIVKLDVATAQLDAECKKHEEEERKRRERECLAGNAMSSGNGETSGNASSRPVVEVMLAGLMQPPKSFVNTEPPKKVTEYYASKKIDSSCMNRELKAEFIRQVVEEIVANLEGEVDSPLEITLDIKASCQRGFSPQTVRVIKENAKVLGFDTSEFE